MLFDKIRRLDINLEVGVSAARGKLTYYMFNEPVFNGFDADLARGLARSVLRVGHHRGALRGVGLGHVSNRKSCWPMRK